MIDLTTQFHNLKPREEALRAYGFTKEGETHVYQSYLCDGQFLLTITIKENGQLLTEVTDALSGESYVLHRVPGAQGAFVGRLREEYEKTLQSVSRKCFKMDVFKTSCAKQVIEYVRKRYDGELEFLWPKLPDSAILRRQDSGKWYAVLMIIPREKLGLAGSDRVEIIDLRMEPTEFAQLIDQKNYFPGWHMNKKHWLTVCLDGSVEAAEIFQRIDVSFALAAK